MKPPCLTHPSYFKLNITNAYSFARAKRVLSPRQPRYFRVSDVFLLHHVMQAFLWNPIASSHLENLYQCCKHIIEDMKIHPLNAYWSKSIAKNYSHTFFHERQQNLLHESVSRRAVCLFNYNLLNVVIIIKQLNQSNKSTPGWSFAPGVIKNLPKWRFGMTPESLNRPQYSFVKRDGLALPAPISRQPNFCKFLTRGGSAGLYSVGSMYLITWLSSTCSIVVEIFVPSLRHIGTTPIFRVIKPHLLWSLFHSFGFSTCSVSIKLFGSSTGFE